MSLTNECSDLGVVAVEVKIQHPGDADPVGGLHTLTNATTLITTLAVNDPGSTYTNARCCPDSGICAITDCDTTDGVINDMSHKTHCTEIHDFNGDVQRPGTEITNGVVTFTPPTEDGS